MCRAGRGTSWWWSRALLLVAVAALSAGCRLDLVAEVTIRADGSGSGAVAITLDAVLLEQLDALGIDPTAELTAAAPLAPGWDVEREAGEDGALTVRLSRDAADPGGVAAAFRELTSGLDDADPALLIDLDVDEVDGAVTVTGRAGLRTPATAGATRDGAPVGPSGEELAALMTEAVSAQLVVTVPGPLVEHDADAVDGTTASWELPIGAERRVHAVSETPSAVPAAVVAGAATGMLVAVGVGLWLWRRQR